MKIFISAVSTQFEACGTAVASDLRASGAEVVMQEDFTQHGGSLLEKLEAYIATCDRVIALVGNTYGWEPADEARLAGHPPRSFAQWEYAFSQGDRLNGSRQLAVRTYVYLASAHFLAQHPGTQSPAAAERQAGFVEDIRRSGKDYNLFGSPDELRRLVLRDVLRVAERPPQPRNSGHSARSSRDARTRSRNYTPR